VGTQDNYQWTWFLRQPLFTGFALLSNYRLAELGIDQSQLEMDLEKLDLVLRVKEAYFNILGADKAVEVAQTTVESLTQTVKVARSFFEVGMIPVNDVLKAEVELANTEQSLVRARNLAQTTRSTFNTVLVRPVNDPVEVEDILVFKPEVGEYDAYVKLALDNRPEIKILDVSLLQADQQIRLAKSKFYPEVGLTYQYISQGDSASVSGSPYVDANHWEALVVANWTFFEWGKTYYSSKEKESLKRQIQETKSDVEDGIRLQVKQSMLDLDSSAKNIPVTQKGIEAGEENLRVNAERYKAQVSTITDLLDAQTLLARARLDYYRALYDHNQAKARLDRALGSY
jgi:outer membrane protein